jgi:hypothetical protein
MSLRKKLVLIAGVLALSACSTPLGPSPDSAMTRQPGTDTRPVTNDNGQEDESVRGRAKPVIDPARARM